MASKLMALSGLASADLDSRNVDAVIRTVMRNDSTPRVFIFVAQAVAGIFSQLGEALSSITSMVGGMSVAVYSRLQSIAPTAGLVEIVVSKNGSGYRLSHASFSSGSSDAFAAAAYSDDARTTFRTLQEFVRCVHQNESFNTELATALQGQYISGVLIDQPAQKLLVVLDTFAGAQTLESPVIQLSYEEGQNSQFGE